MTFLIAFVLVLAAMGAMGVGALVRGRPLRGGCHESAAGCALGGRCWTGRASCEGGEHAGR